MSSAEQLAVQLIVIGFNKKDHNCRLNVAQASLQTSFLCFKSL
jgi:hypothetical protein